jgi:hypothetical protein
MMTVSIFSQTCIYKIGVLSFFSFTKADELKRLFIIAIALSQQFSLFLSLLILDSVQVYVVINQNVLTENCLLNVYLFIYFIC